MQILITEKIAYVPQLDTEILMLTYFSTRHFDFSIPIFKKFEIVYCCKKLRDE